MKAKRFFSLLICLILCSSLILTACNDNPDESSSPDNGNTSASGENIEDYVTMPEFKWEGEDFKEFNVLIYSDEHHATYYCEDVEPGLYSTTDAVINNAVIRRNDEILTKYGVQIKGTPVKDVGETLKLDVDSNLGNFDAALIFMYQAATLAQSDMLYDLNDFKQYIHLDQPWWDQSANEDLSIGGRLFFTTGDISIMPKIVSTAMVFNKEMLSTYFGDLDLYQMVRDKTWTFDKMIEMSREVTSESDGITGMTYNDTWGLSSSYNDVTAFYIASGNNYVAKGGNDLPVISMNSQTSLKLIQDILQKLQLRDEWVFHCNTVTDGSNIWEVSMNTFGQGKALFRTCAFSAIKKLRAYEGIDEFGIVPLPLMSDTQQEYYTYCSARWAYAAAIPTSLTIEQAEFSAYMLDLMAFGGMKHITPAYYETTLKYRDLKDSDSEEMLDLIFSNVVYDIGVIYDFGGINTIIYDLMTANSANIASTYESKANLMQTQIDACIEAYK